MTPSGGHFAVHTVHNKIDFTSVRDEGNWHTVNDEKKCAMAVACLEPPISELTK